MRTQPPPPVPQKSFWSWLTGWFTRRAEPSRERTLGAQEARVLSEFCRQYGLPFKDLALLKLALTHRSYLSVTGQGPRESNERLEFLGDSVLGLVTSEFLYRRHPDEHEGQLTKTKSLLVSKAILSRRALRIGLGRFVLMSHSEVESGGRQRLSILADAFESVIGAIYLDQGFEPARAFIHKHLLAESDAITSDKRHTNYKSHLQEYVQNAFRTHPVYRIRSEYGPDHSKHFMVEVMVGKRTLGEGRGHNKKEAEQAAARDALEKVERLRRKVREDEDRGVERPEREHDDAGVRREPRPRRERAPEASARPAPPAPAPPVRDDDEDQDGDEDASERGSRRRRRSRRGGRGRHGDRAGRGSHAGAGVSAEGGAAADEPEHAPPLASFDAEPEPERSDDVAPQARRFASLEDVGADDELESPRTELSPEPVSEPMRWDEPEPERPRVAPAGPPASERAMSFGRGRRRDPVPAPPAPAAPEERRVDVFAAPAPPMPGPVTQPGPVDAGSPVVDVAADEMAERENDRDRDARIDEMERALESFGRRRTSDYGRRGRRR